MKNRFFIKEMKIYTILVGIISILLNSCSQDTKIESDESYFSEFNNIDTLKFKVLFKPHDFIPRDIHPHDSLLIIKSDIRGQKFWFQIYSLKQEKVIKSILPYGRGPGEALGISSSGIINNTFWAYDITKREILTCNLDSLLESQNASFTTIDAEISSYQIDYYDTSKVVVSLVDEETKYKMSIIDLEKNRNVEKIGLFDNIPNTETITGYKDAHLFYINVKPNKSGNLAILYRYMDLIEIYNNGKLQHKLHGPDQYKVDYELGKRGNTSYMKKTDKTKKAFVSSVATNQFIYGLYSGNLKKSKLWSYGKYIFRYTWDGKPDKSFFSESAIATIGIDKKKLYAYLPEEGVLSYINLDNK
ncbi:BF3164 family lipoprotein [Chondrinema litorale]|uniref:BF3164 family lipoprotein n=1 Tax=Chondrinema litorale TaxID=2994555 RepID=UPI002542B0E2|nr:BF3164 family lipoprotein [Chondrinema litorale]UZR97346.1 BF3164 family lipoprotein [Chondrinema litorale]